GGGRYELYVITVDGAEYIRTPHQALIGQTAPCAQLHRTRDDLLQIRIAGEVIGQAAGYCRVGAAEFDHRRRAARLIVVGIERQGIARRYRKSEGRIDSAEGVLADQG